MKHEVKITALLLGMFFLTQIIGLVVINAYTPLIKQEIINGTLTNVTTGEEIPYGMEPPKMEPKWGLAQIVISLIIAIALFFFLTKIRASLLIRAWFAFVSLLTIAMASNGILTYFIQKITVPWFFSMTLTQILALVVAIPLTFYKIFKRNLFVHNMTELLIYPGLAVIFIPILSVWSMIVLLLVISVYDMYAVWRSQFMVNLAKYQIKNLKIFTGFFVPYMTKEQWNAIKKARGSKGKKVKVSLAILGGGDVAFPLIFAGVMLRSAGLVPALIIVAASTLALLGLFIYSQKGKFYPAMPFLTFGCVVGWLMTFLL